MLITKKFQDNESCPGLVLHVDFRIVQPVQANRFGHPDIWSPSEDGYAEIFCMYIEKGNKFIPFDESLITSTTLEQWCQDLYIKEMHKKELGLYFD